MNPLARELNDIIQAENPFVYQMLSDLGRELYFPKGILSQTAEAKRQATRYNATIGIAREGNQVMYLPSVMRHFSAISPDEVFPYAPSFGKPELRRRWREEMFSKNASLGSKSSSLPLVTSGITHGLSLVGDLFVNPGDVIMLPDKIWGNYRLIFEVRRRAKIRQYPFFDKSGGFNVGGFSEALSNTADGGKILVILNFPNNPTGYSVTQSEATAIRDALVKTADQGCNLVVVCDDAYFGLFYEDDVLRESLYGHLADSHPRMLAVKLDAATKEDYVWGFRLGFITYNTVVQGGTGALYNALEKKTAGAIRGDISNCPHHSQSILLKVMQTGEYAEEKREKLGILQARAARVKQVLSDARFSSVWEPYPFNSGYFMCLRLKGINAEEFRLHLLKDYGIGVISIGGSDIRVAFSCIEERDIPELFNLMFQAAQDLKQH
jgi:aspartate/methionine/tyrosine aminotransferase